MLHLVGRGGVGSGSRGKETKGLKKERGGFAGTCTAAKGNRRDVFGGDEIRSQKDRI